MEDKTFQLLEKMYSELTEFRKETTTRFDIVENDINGLKEDVNGLKEDVNGLKEDVNGLKEDVNGLEEDVNGLKKDVLRIEQNHGKKLDALFDGYIQNTQQLEKIEKEVSRHEDIIIKKVK